MHLQKNLTVNEHPFYEPFIKEFTEWAYGEFNSKTFQRKAMELLVMLKKMCRDCVDSHLLFPFFTVILSKVILVERNKREKIKPELKVLLSQVGFSFLAQSINM